MHDLLIRQGTVIDGSGAPRRRADVAVHGDRIVAVGPDLPGPARRTLQADGLVVAPGFIDVHTHDDALLLQAPQAHPKLLQGVTTVVTGNCGVSIAPLVCPEPPPPLDLMGPGAFRFPRLADYFGEVEATGPAVNAAALVGHSTLRVAEMDDLGRPATEAQCARMRARLAQALDDGALGLSTGVYYPTARAATTQELIEVGAPLRGRGMVTMHIRDEADHIDEALREALLVGRTLEVDLVLSHHKLMGLRNHGRSGQTLALVEEAARSQRVCLDCYPYAASSTILLPERVAMSTDVQITWSRARPQAAGRRLSALAAEAGTTPEEMARRLLPAGAIYFAMSEDDVDRILAHPMVMVGSDGLPHDESPHPRLWGTFPRVLGHYVRERRLLGLEQAVYKMTGLSARRFGLAGRGLLAPGGLADITVFDPATVGDRATFERPTDAPVGIHHVVLNGRLAVCDAGVVDLHAGRVLRRATP